ncbi:MAG TPA: hypothetical protein VGN70_08400 [Gammaproteobacteria bacterium]|jgi:hypothetical protein
MKAKIPLIAISIFILVGIVLIIMRPDTTDDSEDKPTSFGADLAFHFDCKGKTAPPAETVEGFMTSKGFQPLDKVQAGKKLATDFSWMKMDIVGIDSARREITFKGFADQPGSYAVSLYSEPPTTHAKDLEKDLLAFTEKTLGCKNSEVHHVDNPIGAKDLYDKSFSMTQDWYKQAAGIPTASSTQAPPPSTME